MLKNRIELMRDNERQALITWHLKDEDGNTIPISYEFAVTLSDEDRQHIIDVCERPMNVRDKGKTRRMQSGSSKHFLELPKVLSRLGYRTRLF